MATSWVTETKEKENYTKLCRLLYDGGTLAVRTVFDGKWPPASLGATLKTSQYKLKKLKKPAGKVLSQDQWDKLYPPSGASPKSEDFDITLLFVLLRNICSLTPPATGWNALPPSTDTSLEANLVRIKYYRNNVTAHSSKAEVDDTAFEDYWSDISGPLVQLGLKQDDIDELKSSPLGTKDYKQLVEYWDLSDAEIKHKMETIKTDTSEIKTDTSEIKTDTSEIKTDTSEIKTATSQIKTDTSEIKTVTSEIKTDTSEIKTDTSQIKTDTSEIKTDTSEIKTDTSEIKTDTSEIKTDTSEIKTDTSQIKTDTSEIKTDTSEIKTDTSEIKTDTSQIKTDTSEIKTDTSQIKTDTSQIKTDTSQIKTDTSEIKTDTSQIKTDTSEIKTDTSQIKTDTSEIKTNITYLMSNKQNTQVESEITKLAHIDFTSVIQRSCKLYHQSTRQWIFNQVEETVQKASSGASVVLIRAGPGMGKSIVAAKICDIYQKKRVLGGCHFFQHSNSLRNNPRMMLQSIARQLCDSLTGYQAALETKLKTLQTSISNLNCEELFTVLLEEPLSQICIDHNVVIVIDALDECASGLKDEFEDVLRRKLSFLPSWIQFVITTRPLPSCRNLSPLVRLKIDPSDSSNVKDLREFFTFKLQAKRNAQNSIEKLMEIASGSFLVAHFVFEILDENEYETEADILKCFPHGLSSVYEYYFKRIHELIGKPYFHTSDNEDESFFKMLEAMVAAESPIPKELFYNILCLKSENEVQRAKRKERNVAVHLLHTIFPVENDHVSVFHKTVTDWLNLDDENERHEFSVTASNGCEVLAQKSLDVVNAFKKAVEEGEKPFDQPLVLSDSERFALGFGLKYIKKSSKLIQSKKDEIIKNFITMAAELSLDNQTSSSMIVDLLGGSYLDIMVLRLTLINYNKSFYSLICEPEFKERDIFDIKNVPFGCYLSLVGDLCSCKDILPNELRNLRSLCIKYKLPYYSLHSVVSSLPSAFKQRTSSSFSDLFDITNGFIAVIVDPEAKPPTSTVLNIKDDGSFGEHKTFSSVHVRGVSPDKKFLIVTKADSSKIELYDVTTLEKVREYSINCTVDSCHIFGDKQFYIVVKAQGDPKSHILNGLNGQLHVSIEVGENEKIEGVSQCGHILVSHNIVLSTTDDGDVAVDDGDVAVAVDDGDGEEEDDDDDGDVAVDDGDRDGDNEDDEEIIFLKTIHFKNRDETIPYYLQEVHYGVWETKKDYMMKFSDDGKYFAFYDDKCTVYIFNTNDGTLYRIVEFYFIYGLLEIVFLSFSCLVIRSCPQHHNGVSIFAFYDFLNRKLIYSAPVKLTATSRLVVPPQHHTDKSIPTTFFALENDGLMKYEFHNLERN